MMSAIDFVENRNQVRDLLQLQLQTKTGKLFVRFIAVGNVLRKQPCSANANTSLALGINFQRHLNPAVVGGAHRDLKDSGIGV